MILPSAAMVTVDDPVVAVVDPVVGAVDPVVAGSGISGDGEIGWCLVALVRKYFSGDAVKLPDHVRNSFQSLLVFLITFLGCSIFDFCFDID